MPLPDVVKCLTLLLDTYNRPTRTWRRVGQTEMVKQYRVLLIMQNTIFIYLFIYAIKTTRLFSVILQTEFEYILFSETSTFYAVCDFIHSEVSTGPKTSMPV